MRAASTMRCATRRPFARGAARGSPRCAGACSSWSGSATRRSRPTTCSTSSASAGGSTKPPTVYRALDFLIAHGLVHRLESLNAYVGCPAPDASHEGQFLICGACGGVSEFEAPAIRRRSPSRRRGSASRWPSRPSRCAAPAACAAAGSRGARAVNALLEAQGVGVRIGRHELLTGVDLSLHPGEILSLIGPNGAGKTTLLRVLLGVLEPSSGRVLRRPGLTLGYVPQRLQLDPTLPLSVRRFLALGRPRHAAMPPGDALAEVGAGHLERALMAELSGGELQRVTLARALAREPGSAAARRAGPGHRLRRPARALRG